MHEFKAGIVDTNAVVMRSYSELGAAWTGLKNLNPLFGVFEDLDLFHLIVNDSDSTIITGYNRHACELADGTSLLRGWLSRLRRCSFNIVLFRSDGYLTSAFSVFGIPLDHSVVVTA